MKRAIRFLQPYRGRTVGSVEPVTMDDSAAAIPYGVADTLVLRCLAEWVEVPVVIPTGAALPGSPVATSIAAAIPPKPKVRAK